MKKEKITYPEILSPVGSPEAAVAAIAGGADAIYAGLPVFNARMMAKNFTWDDFRKTRELAKAHGVKMYAVVNTLIKEEELQEAVDALAFLDEIEIDGVILQDIGLIRLARNFFKDLPLQVSTQLTVYGARGALFFDDLGFTRVVMPREMSISEAGEIRRRIHAEVKLFSHGALCYGYSGQCHFSSACGSRSGNRGRCAQPCRQAYSLEDQSGQIVKDGFVLATRDLNTIESLPYMIENSIDSIKIEGRLKSPEYVYAVTKAYRDAVDALKNGTEASKEAENVLKAVFQRGFTGGNLYGRDQRLTPEIGKKRGLYIGKTGKTKNGLIEIRLERGMTLSNGDGIAFGKDEKDGTNVSGIFQNPEKTKKADQLKTGKGCVYIRPGSRKQVAPGTPVFKSLDKKLMEKLKKEASILPKAEKKPLHLTVNLFEGAPVVGDVRIEGGETVAFETNLYPEEAKSQALSEERVKEQLIKLGNTGFSAGKMEVNLGENLFLSKKALNQIRNAAVEAAQQAEEKPLRNKSRKIRLEDAPHAFRDDTDLLSVEFSAYVNARDYIRIDADEVIVPFDIHTDFHSLKDLIGAFQSAGKKVKITSPLILNTALTDRLEKDPSFKEALNAADGALVKNYELLGLLMDLGLSEKESFEIEADESLNIMNHESGAFLGDFSVKSGVLSTELSLDEAGRLAKILPIHPVFFTYGRRKLLTSAYCVMDCKNRDCENCRRDERFTLRQADKAYPLTLRDGVNEIYEDRPWVVSRERAKAVSRRNRIFIFDETPAKADEILAYYRTGEKSDSVTINEKPAERGVM